VENKYFELIISEIRPFLSEQGFKKSKNEDEFSALFESKTAAVSVVFESGSSQVKLLYAPIEEEETGDVKTLSSWLFDDQHTDRDAKSIALDFVDSLRETMGIKQSTTRSTAEIELPGKGAPGTSPNIEAFCARFLAICPQYKDTYKEHILKYNDLLYADFFAETAVPHLKAVLDEGNKKQCVKFFDFLDEMYAQGDNIVGAVITAVILEGAFGSDIEAYDKAAEAYMGNAKYLKTRGRAMIMQVRSSARTDKLKFWEK